MWRVLQGVVGFRELTSDRRRVCHLLVSDVIVCLHRCILICEFYVMIFALYIINNTPLLLVNHDLSASTGALAVVHDLARDHHIARTSGLTRMDYTRVRVNALEALSPAGNVHDTVYFDFPQHSLDILVCVCLRYRCPFSPSLTTHLSLETPP